MFTIISLLSKKSLTDLLSNPASALRNSPLCSIPALGLPIAIICPLLSHKLQLFSLLDNLLTLLFDDNVYDYHPIVAKSKLLLNPLFPTLKKGIIQLFIVSLHKVPEFWCSFFFKHKITNFRELLLYYRNKFKQLHDKI